MIKNMNLSLLYDYYGSFLTDKQADIFDLYYNEDLSLSEIGEHLGITRQGARDALKRGEFILSEMEEKIGMVRKANALMKAANILKDIGNEVSLSSIPQSKALLLNQTISEVFDGV